MEKNGAEMVDTTLFASSTESIYSEFDGKLGSNTMYIVSMVDKGLLPEIVRKSLVSLIIDIPQISCHLKTGYKHDSWEPLTALVVDSLIEYEEVPECMDGGFFEMAYLQFTVRKPAKINLGASSPIKLTIFHSQKTADQLVVLSVHHALADGRGIFQLFKLFCEKYAALEHGQEPAAIENVRSISEFLSSLKIRQILGTLFHSLAGFFQPFLMTNLKPLLEKDSESKTSGEGDTTVERLVLDRTAIKQLRKSFGEAEYSLNDIVLMLTLRLLDQYNVRQSISSRYVGVALGVDVRRYFTRDITSISNYSAMEMFIVSRRSLASPDAMRKKLAKIKVATLGLGFFIRPLLTSFFPIAKQKEFMNKWAQNFIVEGSIRMVQTTNIGKLDEYAAALGEKIRGMSFIGPAPRFGFPEISVSGFKGEVTIYFTKYDDKQGLCTKMMSDFNAILEGAVKHAW